MGASSDRRIGIDHDQALADALFANPLRLRFDCSNSTGPSHAFADVHSTLSGGVWTYVDTPVTAADHKVLADMARVCVQNPGADLFVLAEVLIAYLKMGWGDDVANRITYVFSNAHADDFDALTAMRALLVAYANERGIE